MIAFNREFDPPALTVSVTLSGVVHARPRVTVQGIIDTGADISAVPENLSERLRLYRFGHLQLEDARAIKKPVYTYEVQIALTGLSPITMEVVLTPFPFAILGRDWLQSYYLLLNGPEKEFTIGATLQEILEYIK